MESGDSLVLRSRTGNADLVRLPVHALVLDQQHLAAPATELQRADDAIVEQRTGELVLRRVHPLKRSVKQQLLLVALQSAIAYRLRLLVHPHTVSVERRLLEERRRLRQAP